MYHLLGLLYVILICNNISHHLTILPTRRLSLLSHSNLPPISNRSHNGVTTEEQRRNIGVTLISAAVFDSPIIILSSFKLPYLRDIRLKATAAIHLAQFRYKPLTFVEGWLHLSIAWASSALHSVCTAIVDWWATPPCPHYTYRT